MNALGFNSDMPLHLACAKGHYQIVEFLIQNFKDTIDFDAKSKNDDTFLHVACRKGRI